MRRPNPLQPRDRPGLAYFVYTYSTQMAEVEVDVKTGYVDVLNLVATFDIGKAINPLMVEGQIEGGVMMAWLRPHGRGGHEGWDDSEPRPPGLHHPTALDAPEIKPITVEYSNVHGPFGAKGIGEMPNIPAAPAITNAIANAVGARIYDLPAHPERVYMAMKKRFTQGG